MQKILNQNIKFQLKHIVVVLLVALTGGCSSPKQDTKTESDPPLVKPRIVGAMRNVMRKGELFARIDFDTLERFDHLNALGPLENLQGEFMILDGEPFVSTVSDGLVVIESRRDIRAPFTAYTYVNDWSAHRLPEHVKSLGDIDRFLVENTAESDRPFFFRIEVEIDTAVYHVMNLPLGTEVTSPEIAHRLGRVFFGFGSSEATLLGFFSTEHQGIFTHHEVLTHLHILSLDRKHLGHLDTLALSGGKNILYLPTNIEMSTPNEEI